MRLLSTLQSPASRQARPTPARLGCQLPCRAPSALLAHRGVLDAVCLSSALSLGREHRAVAFCLATSSRTRRASERPARAASSSPRGAIEGSAHASSSSDGGRVAARARKRTARIRIAAFQLFCCSNSLVCPLPRFERPAKSIISKVPPSLRHGHTTTYGQDLEQNCVVDGPARHK